MNHLVAFIDILGFSDILKGDIGKAKKKLETIFDLAEYVTQLGDNTVRFYAVSDSVVIYKPVENCGKGPSRNHLKIFLETIRIFQIHCLERDVLIRGGISFGEFEVVINESMHGSTFNRMNFLGSSFLRAVSLESKAKFPRVIIDQSVLNNKVFGFVNLSESIEKNSDIILFRCDLDRIGKVTSFENNDFMFIRYGNVDDISLVRKVLKGKYLEAGSDTSKLEKVDWVVRYIIYELYETDIVGAEKDFIKDFGFIDTVS